MTPNVVDALRAKQSQITTRWAALLRIEPVNTALALPDALVHLIPETLGQILGALVKTSSRAPSLSAARAIALPVCGCNRNPYLSHFRAGERALVETLELVQAESPAGARSQQDLAELIWVTRTLAADEIETFCGVCTHRGESEGCRHHAGEKAHRH